MNHLLSMVFSMDKVVSTKRHIDRNDGIEEKIGFYSRSIWCIPTIDMWNGLKLEEYHRSVILPNQFFHSYMDSLLWRWEIFFPNFIHRWRYKQSFFSNHRWFRCLDKDINRFSCYRKRWYLLEVISVVFVVWIVSSLANYPQLIWHDRNEWSMAFPRWNSWAIDVVEHDLTMYRHENENQYALVECSFDHLNWWHFLSEVSSNCPRSVSDQQR